MMEHTLNCETRVLPQKFDGAHSNLQEMEWIGSLRFQDALLRQRTDKLLEWDVYRKRT